MPVMLVRPCRLIVEILEFAFVMSLLGVLFSCVSGPRTSEKPPLAVSPQLQADLQDYRSAQDAPATLAKIQQRLAATPGAQQTRADRLVYANLLLANQQWTAAEASFQALYQADPNDREALSALVLIAGSQNHLVAQAELLDRWLARFPTDVTILNLKARCLWDQGQDRAALSLWQQSAQVTENAEALKGQARVALLQRQAPQALDRLNRAVALDPSDGELYALRSRAFGALKQYGSAVKDLDQAIARQPQQAQFYLDRARLQGRVLYHPDLALTDLAVALRLEPNNAEAWAEQGRLLEGQGQARPAYEAYLQAAALDPELHSVFPSAAVLAFRFQDFRRATTFARLAGKDYPGEYAFPVTEALSLKNLGQREDAKAVLERSAGRFSATPSVVSLFRFLLTPAEESYLNAALAQEPQEKIRVRLRFYQGCQNVFDQAPASARAAFTEAASSSLLNIPEIASAQAWLDHGL